MTDFILSVCAALVSPYLFSILPAGSVPTTQIGQSETTSAPSFIPTPVLEIRSSVSLRPVQSLPVPLIPQPEGAPPTASNQIIRVLTSSPGYKSPLFLVTTPTDRTLANTEGSSIVQFHMKSWGVQLDELVEAESYTEALSLLESLDSALLPDKVIATILETFSRANRNYIHLQDHRRDLIRALNAVSLFRAGKYADAMNAFIELNTNPAKVVALYPERVSGRLSVPQDDWIPLLGGPHKTLKAETSSSNGPSTHESEAAGTSSPLPRPPSPQGSMAGVLRTGLESLIAGAKKDDDTASIRSGKKALPPKGYFVVIRE